MNTSLLYGPLEDSIQWTFYEGRMGALVDFPLEELVGDGKSGLERARAEARPVVEAWYLRHIGFNRRLRERLASEPGGRAPPQVRPRDVDLIDGPSTCWVSGSFAADRRTLCRKPVSANQDG